MEVSLMLNFRRGNMQRELSNQWFGFLGSNPVEKIMEQTARSG